MCHIEYLCLIEEWILVSIIVDYTGVWILDIVLISNAPFHSLLSKFNSQKFVPIVADCDKLFNNTITSFYSSDD